jgi:hypothetical protein
VPKLAPAAKAKAVAQVVAADAAVKAGEVDEKLAEVARTERELANRLTGLELSGKAMTGQGATFFDEGTVLMEGFAETALRSRQEWEARPTVREAAAAHAATIAAERRKDYRDVALAKLIIDESGYLTRANGGLRPTESSWRQLTAKAPSGTAVTWNLNSWLAKSPDVALLRTRHPDAETGTRELFAALSSKYAVLDGHDLVNRMAERLPAQARAELKYEPISTRLQFSASLHNPYAAGGDEVAVGRMHQVGIRLRTADHGRESIRIRAFVERIRCINCTLVPATWSKVSRRHVGDAGAIYDAAQALFEQAGSVMEAFDEHWSAAAAVQAFAEVEGSASARLAFEALVRRKIVEVPGVERATLVDDLVSAWEYEPGTSWQAVQRAITRAAHTSGYGLDESDTLEDQAGELLFARIWETERPLIAG